ncbi:putative Ras protein [Mycena sanguinolenta]|uniref:Putative Ras protein n=1 Tax=Mycena sanguinolenta TaxID=230812 RepID=A0A8H6WX50_9AGAR|nr:putative Ras protein [Mycena sanguinolenta]
MEEWDVILLGDGGVGKTALATQFTLNCYVEVTLSESHCRTYDPTIQEGFRKYFVVDNRVCFLRVIDTAGQEEYANLRNLWIREGQGFILVYSITSRDTFDRLRVFRQALRRNHRREEEPIMVLVGSKSDRSQEREVSIEEGAALAQNLGCEFFETSARTAKNVNLAFVTLVRALRQVKNPQSQTSRTGIQKRIAGFFKSNASLPRPPREIYQEPPNPFRDTPAAAQHSRIASQAVSVTQTL